MSRFAAAAKSRTFCLVSLSVQPRPATATHNVRRNILHTSPANTPTNLRHSFLLLLGKKGKCFCASPSDR
ncbi:Hypp2595 [Branchiostoma lanceolatum]|uniref:Hypp2595 protein n=1 Tax=Branchiostoma lanceolatum TaxID=7740 RepID=A0A8J9ZT24_BRALA|nr:Hypp2595 [Branchiostoma lanceolatum]